MATYKGAVKEPQGIPSQEAGMFGITWRYVILFGAGIHVAKIVLLAFAAGTAAALARKRGGRGGLWGGAAAWGCAIIKIVVVRSVFFSEPSYEEGGLNIAPLARPIVWGIAFNGKIRGKAFKDAPESGGFKL
jgi:hypothetical protein